MGFAQSHPMRPSSLSAYDGSERGKDLARGIRLHCLAYLEHESDF